MNALDRIRELLGERYIEKMGAGVLVSANTVRNWYRDGGVPQAKYAARVARFAMEQGLKADELSLVRELAGEEPVHTGAPRPTTKKRLGRAGRQDDHNPHCWKKRGVGALDRPLALVPPVVVEAVDQRRVPVREVSRVVERDLRIGMVERPRDVPERGVAA